MESEQKLDEKDIPLPRGDDTSVSKDDNAVLDVGRERLRRPHKKSRKGCLSCKKRHVRCDERAPICTSCLLRGSECDYGVQPERLLPLTRLLSATPSDPFDCMPILMQGRSSEIHCELLSHQNMIISLLHRDNQMPLSAGSSVTQVDLAFANPAWLRLTMMLNLSTRIYTSQSSQNLPPDYEQTLIHHRLGVIDSLKHDAMNSVISYSTLSLMSGMALSDFANGEHSQMFIHIRGIFGILEQTEGTSTQYSLMAKRLLISYQAFVVAIRSIIRGKAGSGINESLCSHAGHRGAFNNRLVICFYQQIINTHQAELAITGQQNFDNRNSSNLLKWLYRRLKMAKECPSGAGQLQGHHGDKFRDGIGSDSDKSALDVAIMAYVVIIGSLDMPNKKSLFTPRSRDPLEKLRHGMKQVIEQWEIQRGLMSEMLTRDFISMMMWLETEQGIDALRYLISSEDSEEGVSKGSSSDGIIV